MRRLEFLLFLFGVSLILGLLVLALRAEQVGAQPAIGNCVGPAVSQAGVPKGCGDFLDFASEGFVVTGTGNKVTIARERPFVDIPAASCVAGTAFANWDLTGTDVPVAACVTGTNTLVGVLDFDDGTGTGIVAPSAQQTFMLPASWVAGTSITVDLKWKGTATTNTVRWCAQIVCVAAGETDDPAFDTAVCVNSTAAGTTLQTVDVQIVLAGTAADTCAANELLHTKLLRDSDNGADTFSGNARLLSTRITF